MQASPFISIIIPTFNSQASLWATLDSILSQTFTAYEIVCVDGGSRDATVELLSEYASRDERVKVTSEKDQGIYDAMNKGIARSRGEWFYFLGSDDCLHDARVLEDMAQVLTGSTAGLVYGDAILVSDQQRYGGEFDVLRLHTVQNLCHQTIFYHYSVFARVGGYNLKYKVLADWELNIRCFRHPEIQTTYYSRDIVVFNNLTGVSSQPYEDPLYQEIPVRYLQELNELKGNRVLNSKAYAWAKSIYGFAKRMRAN